MLTRTLNAKLDGLAAEHAVAVAANVADIKTVEVFTAKVTTTGQETGSSSRQLETHAKDIDRDTRKIINKVKDGVGKVYYAHRVSQSGPDANKLDVRVEVAALLRVDGVVAEIEAVANRFVRKQLTRFNVDIKNTTGATRDAYRVVQKQTTSPEALTVELRANEKAATKNAGASAINCYSGGQKLVPARGGREPARPGARNRADVDFILNKGWRLTHEYLTDRESPCGESGLHRRSPDLTPELQSTVWADEVVVAAQELKMFFELVLRTRRGERSPRQRG